MGEFSRGPRAVAVAAIHGQPGTPRRRRHELLRQPAARQCRHPKATAARAFAPGRPTPSTCWRPSAGTASAPCSCCRPTPSRKAGTASMANASPRPKSSASWLRSPRMPRGPRATTTTDLRISIAGAQEKTALLRMGGKWYRPHGATPTTHILKLPLGLVGNMRADMTDSVENEWLCAQLMSELGIEMAHTEMATFGETKVLVVQRFDRRWQGVDPGAEEKRRLQAARPRVDSPPSAGGPLPGARCCAESKVPGRRRPFDAGLSAGAGGKRARRSRPRRIRPRPVRLLAAGGDRRPCEELLHPPPARRQASA